MPVHLACVRRFATCQCRRKPWTVTIDFEGAVPSIPTRRILGMPTRGCGAILEEHSSSFDRVLVISFCSIMDIKPGMRPCRPCRCPNEAIASISDVFRPDLSDLSQHVLINTMKATEARPLDNHVDTIVGRCFGHEIDKSRRRLFACFDTELRGVVTKGEVFCASDSIGCGEDKREDDLEGDHYSTCAG